MLVLNRKVEESLVIGEGENKIILKVLGTRGKYVKLGFEGNNSVTVLRKEVHDRAKDDVPTAVGEAS